LTPSARIRNIRGDNRLINISGHTLVAGELLVFPHGGEISIGEWCYIGEGTRIWSAASIDIGDRVLISHNVNIFDSLTHPLSAQQRHAQFRAIMSTGHPESIDLGERPVTLGNDVWIGANACVLRGVTIGEGGVVGAGAVVTSDVAPFTVVAGNPARIIRELEPDER
jgi:acetyltransferase-like isoleucine patch superfamily enzyme